MTKFFQLFAATLFHYRSDTSLMEKYDVPMRLAAFRVEGLAFPNLTCERRLCLMFRISKDSPVYYLTSVTNNRLPVFQTAKLKDLVCDALNEARKSAGFLLFAYVIMPDHLHALIGSGRKPSDVTRFVNGIAGRRVIDFLKEREYEASLQKLRRANGARDHKYSLWDHHANPN